MNKRRLLKLAAFLKELNPKLFNLGTVVGNNKKDYGYVKVEKLKELKALKANCGTAACAMGWTPTVFPRLVEFYIETFDDGEEGACNIALKKDTCNRGFDTVAEILFDITSDQAEYLFNPFSNGPYNKMDSGKIKPKFVAKVIEKFVRDDGEIY